VAEEPGQVTVGGRRHYRDDVGTPHGGSNGSAVVCFAKPSASAAVGQAEHRRYWTYLWSRVVAPRARRRAGTGVVCHRERGLREVDDVKLDGKEGGDCRSKSRPNTG